MTLTIEIHYRPFILEYGIQGQCPHIVRSSAKHFHPVPTNQHLWRKRNAIYCWNFSSYRCNIEDTLYEVLTVRLGHHTIGPFSDRFTEFTELN